MVFIQYDCQQAPGLEDAICICSYLLRIKWRFIDQQSVGSGEATYLICSY